MKTTFDLQGALGLGAFLLCLLVAVPAAPAQSRSGPGFESYLGRIAAEDVFPGADRFGQMQDQPRVVPTYAGEELLGYVYLNSDHVNSVGYSGRPIHILVGLDLDGTIVGLRLIDHHEPIVLVGVSERQVIDYMQPYIGYNPVQARIAGTGAPDTDIVSGATVTVLVMGDSVVRSAVRVAQALGLGGLQPMADAAPQAARLVDMEAGEVSDWEKLLGEGSVRRLVLTVGEVNDAFDQTGDRAAIARPASGEPEDTFIELYAALVSQPAIGRSLLGEAGFRTLEQGLQPGQHAVLIAGDGAYSFKGSGYVRGGIFDRIELHQDSETVRFRDRLHRRINSIEAEGAPRLREIGTFVIPQDAEFDPAEPWTLRLLVQRSTGALDRAFVSFDLDYRLPDAYIADARPAEPSESAAATDMPSADAPAQPLSWDMIGDEDAPLWVRIWESKTVSIAVLLVMLGALTLIFFFQDILVKRPKLYDRIRLGFLAITLFWLGWVAQAQLSVVNVLAFFSALRTDFQWSYFMMDPLIFILWFSVAASLLFWGRGPFCGWLCPFGALQELSNRAARAVKVPQITIPWAVHERLWPIKYIIFLVLFGVSLGSLAMAEIMAEVEPFKTAIILRFMREWWFVAFALALIGAGLFVERFFCRYLCPLGAALAIPGRLRMFDWLKRYRECGNPCMRCFNECPVQAIHPEGHINPNECISCLNCQVLYHHDRKCPVMIQRRVKLEKRLAMGQPSFRPGTVLPARPRAPSGATQAKEGVKETLDN